MQKLLQNKHFVNTAAMLIKYTTAVAVLTVLYFAAPEHHESILTAILMIVGGGPIRAKLGL